MFQQPKFIFILSCLTSLVKSQRVWSFSSGQGCGSDQEIKTVRNPKRMVYLEDCQIVSSSYSEEKAFQGRLLSSRYFVLKKAQDNLQWGLKALMLKPKQTGNKCSTLGLSRNVLREFNHLSIQGNKHNKHRFLMSCPGKPQYFFSGKSLVKFFIPTVFKLQTQNN